LCPDKPALASKEAFVVYIILLIFVLVGGSLTWLMLQNSTPAHFSLFSWQSPEMPLGVLLLASFLLGAFLLYAVAIASAWQDRREVKRLRTRIAELEQAQMRGLSGSMQSVGPTAPLSMPGMSDPLQSIPPQQE
jgi:uncharacterized integral membrane protein